MYCKLQINNILYAYWSEKKNHHLMFKVLKSTYTFESIDLFVNKFVYIFDFRQV